MAECVKPVHLTGFTQQVVKALVPHQYFPHCFAWRAFMVQWLISREVRFMVSPWKSHGFCALVSLFSPQSLYVYTSISQCFWTIVPSALMFSMEVTPETTGNVGTTHYFWLWKMWWVFPVAVRSSGCVEGLLHVHRNCMLELCLLGWASYYHLNLLTWSCCQLADTMYTTHTLPGIPPVVHVPTVENLYLKQW